MVAGSNIAAWVAVESNRASGAGQHHTEATCCRDRRRENLDEGTLWAAAECNRTAMSGARYTSPVSEWPACTADRTPGESVPEAEMGPVPEVM